MAIVILKKTDEMKQVCCLEGAVFEREEFDEVFFLVLLDELKRGIVHQRQQLIAFVDDGGSVAPCKNGSEKSCDFYILLLAELMRDGNWIFFNERGLIESI
jgi:hypothetical protein